MKKTALTLLTLTAVMATALTFGGCTQNPSKEPSKPNPLQTAQNQTTAPITTAPITTAPITTAPVTTAPATSATTAKPTETTAPTTTPKQTTAEDKTNKPADKATAAAVQPTNKVTFDSNPKPLVENQGKAKEIRDLAAAQEGAKFKLCSASREEGFDNPGLIYYVLNNCGIPCPRLIKGIAEMGSKISYDKLQPGDVVLFQYENDNKPHYGGIYLGEGKMAAAYDENKPVLIVDITTNYYKTNFMWGICVAR